MTEFGPRFPNAGAFSHLSHEPHAVDLTTFRPDLFKVPALVELIFVSAPCHVHVIPGAK